MVMQVYAPTAASTEEDLEDFYNNLTETVEEVPKQEILIVMGIVTQRSAQKIADGRRLWANLDTEPETNEEKNCWNLPPIKTY